MLARHQVWQIQGSLQSYFPAGNELHLFCVQNEQVAVIQRHGLE